MLVAERKYESEVAKGSLNPSAQAVIKTLLYFDIFQYPITVEEIYEYCNQYPATKSEIEKHLDLFEESGYVSHQDDFYLVKNENMEGLVKRRLNGNREAAKFLKIAKRFSKFISYFPFVKGICLSGSLSKGYADRDSDIDYFIITEPGRLWISRTLLILFKKLFLFNSHKYFCVNYFIDTNSLAIPDKNLFAATELLSIIPACNADLYEKLMQANTWVKDYFPNGELKTNKYPPLHANRSIIKKIGERFFFGKWGDKIDDLCFRATLKTWKRKFKDFNPEEFDLNLRTRKNVSKHHPNGFQLKVMKNFNDNVSSFERRFNISLG